VTQTPIRRWLLFKQRSSSCPKTP